MYFSFPCNQEMEKWSIPEVLSYLLLFAIISKIYIPHFQPLSAPQGRLQLYIIVPMGLTKIEVFQGVACAFIGFFCFGQTE